MKVILINGSPKKNGNTFQSLSRIAERLNEAEIDTEIVTIGSMNICGCKACGGCSKTGECVYNDGCNEIFAKMREADGIVFGSPVYYSGINGTMKSFLDRAFYTSSKAMRFKVGAAVVALRRSGATLALQTINQYFAFSEMLVTPTIYWPAVHGSAPGESTQDLEGMNICDSIGVNMAYLLKMKAAGGIPEPAPEKPVKFNYIR